MKKWYIYQKERFPIITYGVYIFSIVLAVFFYSSAVSNTKEMWKLIPMFIFAFLEYVKIRIVDEHKDYEDDLKYRPYRPVPRGLVTLDELKVIFLYSFIIQLAIAVMVNGANFYLYLALWVVFLFFTNDFFIKKFLDKHILLTVFLDEILIVVLAIYLASFIMPINIYLWPIILMVYIISWIVEVARKIRAKEDEEEGVKTYTAVLGADRAIYLLFVLETFLTFLHCIIMNNLIWTTVYGIVQIINILFSEEKNRKYAKLVELSANIYIIFTYFSLGLLLI